MKLIKAIAGIMAIFVLGVMTGVLGASLVVKHRIEMFHEKGPPPIKPMLMKRLTDRLDLTPAQHEAVEKILDDLQVQIRELRHDFQPKIKEAFDSGFEHIREQLTDSQKRRLELLLKELPDHFPFQRHFWDRDHDRFHQKKMPPEPE
jgi:hypothetical protein